MAENKEEKKVPKAESGGTKGDPEVKPAEGNTPARKSEASKSSTSKSPDAGQDASGTKAAKEKPAESSTGAEPEEDQSYLKDLMSISGHGGLFRFVSQGRNGIIVESLETGKRMQVFASMKVSALEDIAVYTGDKEVQLEEVFAAIHKYENGKEAISPKSESDELKDYFSAILPDYDRERVYASDIKKILSWYNLLLKENLIEIGKIASHDHDKSHDPLDEVRKDPTHAQAKPVIRSTVKKEAGGTHSKAAETRIPGKRITAGGKKGG
jgi:hypothetical protein